MVIADGSTIVPRPTPETQPYWDGAAEHRLVIQCCTACGEWNFPPRRRCPQCEAEALEWTQASGRGRLWSYIIVHRAEPEFAERTPYVLGVVELDEGPHLMGTVIGVDPDPAALPIDAPLTVAFEQRGETALPVWQLEVER